MDSTQGRMPHQEGQGAIPSFRIPDSFTGRIVRQKDRQKFDNFGTKERPKTEAPAQIDCRFLTPWFSAIGSLSREMMRKSTHKNDWKKANKTRTSFKLNKIKAAFNQMISSTHSTLIRL